MYSEDGLFLVLIAATSQLLKMIGFYQCSLLFMYCLKLNIVTLISLSKLKCVLSKIYNYCYGICVLIFHCVVLFCLCKTVME